MRILLDVFNDILWYAMRGGLFVALGYWGFTMAHAARRTRLALPLFWLILVAVCLVTASVADPRPSVAAISWHRAVVTLCECIAMGAVAAVFIDREFT